MIDRLLLITFNQTVAFLPNSCMPLRKSFAISSLDKNSLAHIGCVDDRRVIFWVQTTGDDSTA